MYADKLKSASYNSASHCKLQVLVSLASLRVIGRCAHFNVKLLHFFFPTESTVRKTDSINKRAILDLFFYFTVPATPPKRARSWHEYQKIKCLWPELILACVCHLSSKTCILHFLSLTFYK